MTTEFSWDSLRTVHGSGESSIEVSATTHSPSSRDAARTLASNLGIEAWETADIAAYSPAFEHLSLAQAQTLRSVLMRESQPPEAEAAFVGVLADPLDSDLRIRMTRWAGGPIRFVVATTEDIHAYLNQQEAISNAVESANPFSQETSVDINAIEILSLSSLSTASSPAVRLVKATLYDALRAGASDVHFESTPSGLTVKYRIDGVLDEITTAPGATMAEQTISRIKVLAELDIGERRIPQDGSFRVAAQGRGIDLRVSIIPGLHGEDAVIRILDKQAMIKAQGMLSLDSLGFDSASVATLRALMKSSYGMMLVTGPTGSGKTTTLYAALSESLSGRDKIITIEDPVEYQLAGVLQIPVNEKKGLTFARGLRSILRHDPDKIMVGEIRDKETAEIAVQSALTGHLVLTTVHANNVFDVFGRFAHMGMDPYALLSALNGVWAQRLLRINCTHCSRPYDPSPEDVLRAGVESTTLSSYTFLKGAGCGDCRGTGFKGRRAVAEILRLDDDLREMICAKKSSREIREAARLKGTVDLTQGALNLARQGVTTLDEVLRATVA